MPMTSKEMVRYLRKNGFKTVRQRGSHQVLHNSKTNRTVVVPMHNKTLTKGTEQGILKRAGLK